VRRETPVGMMNDLADRLRGAATDARQIAGKREIYRVFAAMMDIAADRIAALESKLSAKKGEALFHEERTVYLENRVAELEAKNTSLMEHIKHVSR